MSTFLFTAKIFGHNHSCFYELDIYDNGGGGGGNYGNGYGLSISRESGSLQSLLKAATLPLVSSAQDGDTE